MPSSAAGMLGGGAASSAPVSMPPMAASAPASASFSVPPQAAFAAPAAPAPAASHPDDAHAAPRRSRFTARRRTRGSVDTRTVVASRSVRGGVTSKLLSGTAMLFAGGLLVGTTLPANALDVFTVSEAGDTSMLASAIEVQGQKIEVSEDIAPILVERDSFEVKSWADQLRDRYGTRGSYTYSVGAGGTVRWPFPYYVPISSGYGERAAPCRGCSTTHNAIDLTPGAGAPIYAIADGVVIRREPRGGSWGNNLTIEHKVNGQTVTSSYAHMQWDSSPVELGDTIKVGDFLGLVGATGQATGAHLHLEIKVNGSYVNPYTWLKENAG
ncbi:M23 family metallopeptidase [Salinibacterium sp. ZJ77]|uniref:M23 family metallopeptidase n=1 Tax=Salinibacterium sp. ZJ77 TaxID=2708337 RepID=UPI0014217AD2|nr:M23 family metallopeptidase [Salinibacterium sp. ZJ77]